VVATFIDITERKQAEETSQAAKTTAEQANAQKSQFLAATSHDLRQPLQTLTLLNATLLQQVREQQPLALLTRQSETLHSMGELLNALLDISQLDAGKLTPTLSAFPVDPLFYNLQEEFNLQAQEKGLEFRVRSCPLHVYSDRALLERILTNFLANAIRYTKRGKILLAARRRGAKLHLMVWDTGCGFPQDRLQEIFSEFYQLKNAAGERSKGVGLGLAIANRLARLLNHRLYACSTEGKGSTFAVEVPITAGGFPSEPQHQAGETEPPSESTQPLRGQGCIVLIEDDPAVAESLALYLQLAGFQVLQANQGEEALAQVRNQKTAPDAVISDYRLPGEKNGFEIIRDIRQLLGRDLPAILLTGDTRALLPENVAAEKCHLLSKPVTGKQIVTFLNQLMN
jgi:two-component system, chemotaxis family, CheB/CheR fusion protein